jgi:hypothetical protein
MIGKKEMTQNNKREANTTLKLNKKTKNLSALSLPYFE